MAIFHVASTYSFLPFLAFHTSVISKITGILLLAGMILISAAAGSNEATTASVVSALHISPPANRQTFSPLPVEAASSTPILRSGMTISVVDEGLTTLAEIHASDVKGALEELGVHLSEADQVIPSLNEPLASGGTIQIARAHDVTVHTDGTEQHVRSAAPTVQSLLTELHITTQGEDRVEPIAEAPLPENGIITVTHVTHHEITEEEAIAFETHTEQDANLEQGRTITDQEGKAGLRRITYTITEENGEETSREKISEETVREPETRKIRTGTKVPPPPPTPTPQQPSNPPSTGGNVAYGRATFYWGPTAAASNLLPKGTRVRVTNTNTGASLEVVIDDTGGFRYPTIIDLRDDLFARLAPLSNGIFPVKVEVI